MKFAVAFLLLGVAFASNPQDEQTVRNAYAKLAYAVQSKTVYVEAQKHPNITSAELGQKLQANELRFEISEMSSGSLSDIASRPYSDFVTRPEQNVLEITNDQETFTENGQLLTSYFAVPRWAPGQRSLEDWDTPVGTALAAHPDNKGKFSRYVAATITVRFQGHSRTYRALWLFGADTLAVDLVTGNIVRDFTTESAYPSVLADTNLRSHRAVEEWLTSTQRFDATCKPGKQDVCCDAAMRCGISAEDLRSTKPAPSTKAVPKGGL